MDWLAPGEATHVQWKTYQSGEETQFVLSHGAKSELVGKLDLLVRVEDASVPYFTAKLGNELNSREAFVLPTGLYGPHTYGVALFSNAKGEPLRWKSYDELTVIFHGSGAAKLAYWDVTDESRQDDLKKAEVRERLHRTGFALFLVSVLALILKHVSDFVKAWKEWKSPEQPYTGLGGLFDDMIRQVRGSNDAETAELQAFLRRTLFQKIPVATALEHLTLPDRSMVFAKSRHQLLSQLTMTISALEGVRAWAQNWT